MVQSLVDYVKKEVAQGFSVDQIRAALIKYGYSQPQIDEAIKQYYSQGNKKGPVHQTKTIKPFNKNIFLVAGAVIFLVFLLIGTFSFIGDKRSSVEQETTLTFDAVTTTISPGKEIVFNKKAFSTSETSASISYQLINKKNDVVLTDYETFNIKNRITSQKKITIPSNTPLGDYQLKIISRYDNQEDVTFLQIKLFESSSTPTCFDNIKNQDEEEIDCGGIYCQSCRTCPDSCNDNDECTEDSCNEQTDYKCRHVILESCRLSGTTSQQNQQPEPLDSPPSTTLKTVRSELYNSIKNNPVEAAQTCDTITEVLEKDICFKTVAELSNSSNFCNYIERPLTKDSCYMKFVLKNSEFQHCDYIEDDYLKDSCDNIKRLKEMEAQYLAIQQPN